jgi:hypothetical protein
MNIFELLSHPIFNLPKHQDSRSYEVFLLDTFNEYSNLLYDLEDFEIHQEHTRKIKAKELFEKSMFLGKAIIRTIREYNFGRPYKAFEEFKSILDKYDFIYKTSILLGGEDFYRVRVSENKYSFNKNEIFHIPFHLKHLICTQRYSIPGFPCLYLSDSLFTCWEEMKRPDLNKLHASRFNLKKTIQLLEIPNPKNEIDKYVNDDSIVEGVFGIGIDSLLVNFPLYLACSIQVKKPKNNFKIEYVIPQLLLQYIRNNDAIAGIKYFSTNIDPNSNDNIEGHFNNYVFPVKESTLEGFCPILEDTFSITEPISLSMIQNSGRNILFNQNELESSVIKSVELIKGEKIPYSKTPFAILENKLLNMEAKKK